jgi:hypothetical protein
MHLQTVSIRTPGDNLFESELRRVFEHHVKLQREPQCLEFSTVPIQGEVTLHLVLEDIPWSEIVCGSMRCPFVISHAKAMEPDESCPK